MFAILREAAPRPQFPESRRFQAGSADQGSVDIRLCEQIAGVGRLDAATVQDANLWAIAAL